MKILSRLPCNIHRCILSVKPLELLPAGCYEILNHVKKIQFNIMSRHESNEYYLHFVIIPKKQQLYKFECILYISQFFKQKKSGGECVV